MADIKVSIDGSGAKAGRDQVVRYFADIKRAAEDAAKATGAAMSPAASAAAAARTTATRNPAGDAARGAQAAARAAADAQRAETARARALEGALTRRAGLEQRIARQLGENAELTSRLDQATAAYAAQIRNLTPGTVAWTHAMGDFRRETQAVSGEIARQGGLLKVLNTNADRTINAIGKGSKLASYEVKNLGYQLNDVAVSLASGQNPLMVAVQQGAQIGQIFSGKGLGIGGVLREVGSLLLRLVTPFTVIGAIVAGLGLAVSDFASKGAEIQKTADLLGLSAERTQVLEKTLQQIGRGTLGDFAGEAQKFAVALDDAARNPTSQLARLFQLNGKSLTDSNGKLKDQATLWKTSIGLIQGAANEIQALKIGDILGLQQDFTEEVYRGRQGFDDVQKSVQQTGLILDNETVKRAADFEKAWGDAWRDFRKGAGDAITSVEAAIVGMIGRVTGGITNVLRDPKTYGMGPGAALAAGPNSITNAPPLSPDAQARLDQQARDATHLTAVPQPLRSPAGPLVGTLNGLVAMPPTSAQIIPIPSRPDVAVNQPAPASTGGPARIDRPTLVPGNSPPKGDPTGDRYKDQVADIRAQIAAQDALNTAYGQGAQAVAAAQREQQIANENTKISAKYTTDQRTEIEKLNVALIDSKRNGVGAEQLAGLQAQNAMIQAEIGLVGKSTAEREKELAVIRAKAGLVAAGVDPTRGVGKQVVDETAHGADLSAELTRQQQNADAIADMWTGAFDRVSSAITEAFAQGSGAAIDFGSIAQGVVADLAASFVKLAVLNPLKNALGLNGGTTLPTIDIGALIGGGGTDGITNLPSGMSAGDFYKDPAAGAGGGGGLGGILSSFGSFLGSIFHEGGVVGGSSSRSRSVSMSSYIGAPRYHTGGMAGFAPDEVPAILRRGEEVIPANDPRHRWNQTPSNDNRPTQVTNKYTVVNQTGQPVEVQEQSREKNQTGGDDITVLVDTMVAKKMRKKGTRTNQALRQDYGASQRLRGR